ncbi:MAG: hypothetical protein KDI36_06000 [Pseudomonadales bacterium]|nr:hypothetical protein [Pseudomonadales bacterium]
MTQQFQKTSTRDPPEQTALPAEPLDVRIFNTICLLIMATSLATLIINLVVASPLREFVYSITAIVISSVIWYLSARRQQTERLRTPLFLLFLTLLSVAWFTNHGALGSTPYFIIALFTAGMVILRPEYRLTAMVLTLIWMLGLYYLSFSRPDLISEYESPHQQLVDIGLSVFVCLVINTLLVYTIIKEYQLEKDRSERLATQLKEEKEKLEQLLEEVNVLRGILPVCSFCKKIRDDQGDWQPMEHYISSRSDARFSHSFCPECGEKHYPDEH